MRTSTSSRLRNLSFILVFAGVAAAGGAASAQTPPKDRGKDSVLVLPFLAQSGAGSDWMGRSIQQDLLADLTQGTAARVSAPANVPAAADPAAALQSAHSDGATWVVFGQVQVSGAAVRITGQVLDVADGKPLGVLKATGPSAALFHLEDAAAGQVFAALPRTALTAQTLAGMERAAGASNQQQSSAAAPGQSGALQPAAPQVAQPQALAAVAPQYLQAADAAGLISVAPQAYYPSYPDDSYAYPDLSYIDGGYSAPYTYGYPDCDLWPGCDTGLFIGGFGGLDRFGRRGLDGRGLGAAGRFGNRGLGAVDGRSGITSFGFNRAGIQSRATPGARSFGGARTVSPSRSGGFGGAAIRGGGGGGHAAGGGGGHGGGGHR